MRATSKAKKATTDSEQVDVATNAKVDEETSIIKKKRAIIKFKKTIIDNENNNNVTKINLFITFLVISPKKRDRKTSTVDDANVNVSDSKPKTSKKAKIIESLKNSIKITTFQEFSSITKARFLRKRAVVTKEKVVREASCSSDGLMFSLQTRVIAAKLGLTEP